MLSASVPSIINISCGTYPTSLCHSLRLVEVSFLPSISISPDVGGKKPSIRLKRVDFPEPLAPRTPIRSPRLTTRSKPLKSVCPSGNANSSPHNSRVWVNSKRDSLGKFLGNSSLITVIPSSTTVMVCEAF